MVVQRAPDISQNLNPDQMKQVLTQGAPPMASSNPYGALRDNVSQGIRSNGAMLQEVPEERRHPQGVPFMEVHPTYNRVDDACDRQIAMRSLEEALRGDVSVPMPKPVVLVEDYDHYREGKYVKDDCLMA